jgi:hypothetical protein
MTQRYIKPTPTRERLRELFYYSVVEGALYWRAGGQGRRAAHIPAGVQNSVKGYIRITVDYKAYPRHRLVWAYFYGDPGAMLVDHINGNRSDDRIENLRLASESDNRRNSKFYRTNTSGYKGVTLEKSVNKWKAYIYINNRRHHLGLFPTPEEAHAAYCAAAAQHFGEFARAA